MRKKRSEDIACCDCGVTPSKIIFWKGKWRCEKCDELRRRREIEATGTIIDDQGVACVGCLFGIRLVDLCVVDPDGEGPYHRNCALANCDDLSQVRLAPDEFKIFECEDFDAGEEVKVRKN